MISNESAYLAPSIDQAIPDSPEYLRGILQNREKSKRDIANFAFNGATATFVIPTLAEELHKLGAFEKIAGNLSEHVDMMAFAILGSLTALGVAVSACTEIRDRNRLGSSQSLQNKLVGLETLEVANERNAAERIINDKLSDRSLMGIATAMTGAVSFLISGIAEGAHMNLTWLVMAIDIVAMTMTGMLFNKTIDVNNEVASRNSR